MASQQNIIQDIVDAIYLNTEGFIEGDTLQGVLLGMAAFYTHEASYRFSQGATEFPDLLIGGVIIDTVSVTVGIATKEISINGGAYVNLIAGVSIPAGANITIKITYNIGYNGGTVAIKGGVQ